MLRALLLVLLLANGLLFAARQGWLGQHGDSAERDPQRLARQVNADQVQVLPEAQAQAVLARADERCLEAGPFNPGEAPAAERALHDAGLPADSWQRLTSNDHPGFMITITRLSDREAVLRKLDELKRHRVHGEVLADGAEFSPGVNLGRFDDRATADSALAAMVQRGVRTARVVAVRAGVRQLRLRVPQADAALRARLASLKLPSGPGFTACAVPPTRAANGAAAGSKAAATAAAPTAASRPPASASAAAVTPAAATPAPAPAAVAASAGKPASAAASR